MAERKLVLNIGERYCQRRCLTVCACAAASVERRSTTVNESDILTNVFTVLLWTEVLL
jgi:hypothetical protein